MDKTNTSSSNLISVLFKHSLMTHLPSCQPELLFVICHNRIRSHFTTDGQSVSSMSLFPAHSGTCVQILIPVWKLRFCLCGRPLWREDRPAVYSAITQGSESLSTCKHTLLFTWDSPNLEDRVPVLTSLKNRVVQIYPRALGSHNLRVFDLSKTTFSSILSF
jgi:hypothetical protein